MADRFMIAPYADSSGLQTNVRPWIIPDEAFSQLNNAYVFRGRVRKRFGGTLLNNSVDASVAPLFSRLRINLGNTDGSGNASGTVPGVIFKIGQLFSVGTTIFTVFQTGTPAAMLSTGAATGTYNTTTGAYTITGAAAATAVYFYPAEPVMGFITYETAPINDEPVYAFDTQFAYQFDNVTMGWVRLGTAVWTGDNSQFFWGATWRGTNNYDRILYVTNFNPPDLIKYWDGTSWANLNPVIDNAGNTLQTARIIVPFKDRLLALNTVEDISATNRSFPNRCRFSQNGSPLAVNAWNQDVPGSGSFIDAPTSESIITVEFIKDRLIVFFERSTWELVYTGNQILPFVWQQINTELGAESTFSVVPFDKVALGVGNVGIHACNGSNVERIDDKIPDTIFEVTNNNEGVFRVYGIRDFFVEMVYWTFPSSDNATFPRRVLVYNYKTGTWAFNDDSITAFGYFQNPTSITWASSGQTWEQGVEAWSDAPLIAKFRQVIAGNQEGFTFLVDSDEPRNSPALQITNITFPAGVITLSVIDNNLVPDDYILIENVQGSGTLTNLNGNIYAVVTASTDQITIIDPTVTTGTYTGGGTIARVSQINIFTKQYNFYVKQDRNVNINRIDFQIDSTTNGQITVDIYPSSGALAVDSKVLDMTPYGTLYPYESEQTRLWHPIYPSAEGEFVQLNMYVSDAQIRQPLIAFSDFELHAMTFYTNPTTSRLQ
jgi:hypothetical protein